MNRSLTAKSGRPPTDAAAQDSMGVWQGRLRDGESCSVPREHKTAPQLPDSNSPANEPTSTKIKTTRSDPRIGFGALSQHDRYVFGCPKESSAQSFGKVTWVNSGGWRALCGHSCAIRNADYQCRIRSLMAARGQSASYDCYERACTHTGILLVYLFI